MSPASDATRADAARLVVLAGRPHRLEGEWASDQWRAGVLGASAGEVPGSSVSTPITQAWLREPVKRWSRFRLATGCSFTTISAGALALAASPGSWPRATPSDEPAGITRPVLEDYLAWLLDRTTRRPPGRLPARCCGCSSTPATATTGSPGWPPAATIYVEELPVPPRRPGPVHPRVRHGPDRVRDRPGPDAPTTARNLLVLLIETGLRSGDACNLAFNPVIDDSTGWPCLRFDATKVRAEQLVPLSAKAAKTIHAQQDHVRQPLARPAARGCSPGIADNADGSKPYRTPTSACSCGSWCDRIGLHDEAGQPLRDLSPPVPPHFRDPADQLRGPPAHRAAPARPRLAEHDRPLRPDARHHHPRSLRRLPGHPSQHRRRAASPTTPKLPPPMLNGSNRTSTGSATACPTATAPAPPSRTARTPTPA